MSNNESIKPNEEKEWLCLGTKYFSACDRLVYVESYYCLELLDICTVTMIISHTIDL
jgi:hypothetical protein